MGKFTAAKAHPALRRDPFPRVVVDDGCHEWPQGAGDSRESSATDVFPVSDSDDGAGDHTALRPYALALQHHEGPFLGGPQWQL